MWLKLISEVKFKESLLVNITGTIMDVGRSVEKEIQADHGFTAPLCLGFKLTGGEKPDRGGMGVGYDVCAYL
jgi:hypothetical protein